MGGDGLADTEEKRRSDAPLDGRLLTEENGVQYFVCGKNRIRISEHFDACGPPLDDLILDAVRHIAGRAESA